MDSIQKMPKWALVAVGVVLIGLLGWGMVRFALGDKLSSGEETGKTNVVVFPDGEEDKTQVTKLEEMTQAARQTSSANDYWNSLNAESGEAEGGLASTNRSLPQGGRSRGGSQDEYLDPSVYSELEIYYIRRGIKTKAEIDAKHAELKAIDEANQRQYDEMMNRSSSDPDSIYFARMERAYQLAQKYSQDPDKVEEQQPADPAEPEPRRIEVETKAIPSTTLAEDGIISSLESGSMSGGINHVDGEIVVSPAKATFLKSETIVSGQRVIMRLVQDLRLSDGTLIPSNTHVTGICSIKSRLEIKISTVNYGGRIYYTDIDVFDNDGTEGIYCPVIVDKKAGKKVGQQVAQIATQVAGTVASVASPYAGMVARSGTQDLMSLTIDSNGNKSVKVSAGYEFYVFENTEKDK